MYLRCGKGLLILNQDSSMPTLRSCGTGSKAINSKIKLISIMSPARSLALSLYSSLWWRYSNRSIGRAYWTRRAENVTASSTTNANYVRSSYIMLVGRCRERARREINFWLMYLTQFFGGQAGTTRDEYEIWEFIKLARARPADARKTNGDFKKSLPNRTHLWFHEHLKIFVNSRILNHLTFSS